MKQEELRSIQAILDKFYDDMVDLSSERGKAMTAQPKAWLDQTKEERTAYLVPLLDQQVKFALNAEVDEGRLVFGKDFPTPWYHGKLLKLLAVEGRAGVQILVDLGLFDIKLPANFSCDILYSIEPE